MNKTLGISTEAYKALLNKKAELVEKTGKSPTYSKIILDALGVSKQ